LDASRLEILKKIEQGELSVEEGYRQINQPDRTNRTSVNSCSYTGKYAQSAERAPEAEVIKPSANREYNRWRIWSWIGFGIFTLLTAVSVCWMVLGWQAQPWGWKFWLSWVPFLIGVGGMALMFNTCWLHIRIRQVEGRKLERIAISIPFPLGLVAWFVRTFPFLVPEKTHGVEIGEILAEMNRGIHKDQPIFIQVDDEDREHVEIFIG